MSIPRFAVVGRVNEGKSSIVAALTETEDIAIGPEPGTTRVARAYPLAVGGDTLLEVIDTPGFQQPEAVFAWLAERAPSAADRPAAVRAFLGEFTGKGVYDDECELLTPIMAGATVVYVVDASHPFRKSYELEMQILRWTGRPCVALLNQTSASDHVAEWRVALKQYFDRVDYFNAQKNVFEDRFKIFSALAALVEEDRAALGAAVARLQARDEERLARSARVIARLMADMLGFTLREAGVAGGLGDDQQKALETRFAGELRRMEARARDQIEALYGYRKLSTVEDALAAPAFAQDLFAGEVWEFLGLTKLQLVTISTVAAAIAGGAIDALTFGHTFGAVMAVTATLGFAGGAYAAFKAPEANLFGLTVSGSTAVIGPHRDRQFPWVVLDRALLHQRAVARRPHAVREALAVAAKRGLVAQHDNLTNARLLNLFDKLKRGGAEKHVLALQDTVLAILREAKSTD